MKTTDIRLGEITKRVNDSITETFLLGFHGGMATLLVCLEVSDNERYLEIMKNLEEDKKIDYGLLLELVDEIKIGVKLK